MKKNLYTIVILLVVVITYSFPQYFIEFNGVKLTSLITPILMVIMFGMGTTITYQDIIEIAKTPKKVGIGVVLHFVFMPLLGYTIAKTFSFPAEIAAGIILIGCSPSGLASHVICLLAKANVPLSIAIGTVGTLLASITTPLLMRLLGGAFIEVDFLDMAWHMIELVVIPVGLGFLLNRYLPTIVVYIKKILPIYSMIGIAYIIGSTTAAGQASLASMGILLFVAVLIHNLGGYTLGYWSSKLLGLDERDSRTVAFEVGMQNAGLASALAAGMGKVATVGLAAAIFGPLMNTTGSMLATYWSKRPTGHEDDEATGGH
jgi:BASS family bile acid:Na+ symporter